MNWLIKKLKVKVPFDENKLYASEILSILLQTEPENRKLFGELDAIDILLQQLAYYKRHDPGEKEILFKKKTVRDGSRIFKNGKADPKPY